MMDHWTIMEPYLPSANIAKCTQIANPVQSGIDSLGGQASSLSKVKLKLASELITAIPLLASTDSEQVLQFLIRATQVVEMKLLTDSEFMALLMSRTSGRVMQILGAHIGTGNDWGMGRSEIISNFLPAQVKEQFLTSHVLERFQASGKNLTNYVMSVVAAAKTLEYEGPEQQLVRRMV
jgi:hypothetical protein